MALKVGELFASFSIDSSSVDGAMNQIEQSCNKLGSSMMRSGAGLSAAVTAPIVKAAKEMYTAGTDFEAQMSKVQAIAGLDSQIEADAAAIKALTDEALEMGSTTEWTSKQAGEALEYMAMAGWKTDEMLAALPQVMNLATAAGADLGTTSDIVTDAMTAFGLSATDMVKVTKDGIEQEVGAVQYFTDILAATSTNANTNVELLGESFKFVAPLAGAYGYSLNDVATALGLMANNGIKGSMAGTSLSRVIQNITKPSDTAAAAMDRLGISLTNSDGSMKSLQEIMGDFRTAAANNQQDVAKMTEEVSKLTEQYNSGKLSEEEYEAALSEVNGANSDFLRDIVSITGARGLPGLLAIMNASEEDFNGLANEINNATGATDQMAETMRDNAKGAVTKLKSAIEGLEITLWGLISDTFKGLIEKVTEVVDKFRTMDEGTQKAILKFGALAAAAGPVLIVAGKLVKTIPAATKAIAALASPMGLVVAGLALFAVAAVDADNAIGKSFESIAKKAKSKLQEFNSTIEGKMKTVADRMPALIDSIITGLNDILPELFTAATNIITGLMNAFTQNADKLAELGATVISNVVEGIGKSLPKLIPAAAKLVVSLVSAIIKNVPKILSAGAELIKGLIEGIMSIDLGELATSILEAIGSIFSGDNSEYGTIASDICSGIAGEAKSLMSVFQPIGDIIKAVIETVKTLWEKIKDNGTLETLKSAFSKAFELINGIVGKAIEWFEKLFVGIDDGAGGTKSAFGFMVDAVAGVIDIIAKAIDWVLTFINDIGEIPGVMETINGIIDTLAAVVTGAWEIIDGVITAIVQVLNGDFSGAWETIKAAGEGAWNSIKTAAEGLWEGLKTLFAPVAEWFQGIFNDAATLVQGAWDSIVQFFTDLWTSIKEDPVLGGIATAISGFFENAWNTIKGVWDTVAQFFTDIWTAITGDDVLAGLGEAVSNFFTGCWDTIKAAWDTVTQYFSDIWTAITSNEFLTALGDTVSKFFTDAWDAIKAVWDTVSQFFSDLWSSITTNETLTAIGTTISEFFTGAWDKIKEVWDTVTGFFSDLWTNITGNETLTKIGDTISGFFTGAWDTIKAVWDTVVGFFSGIWTDITTNETFTKIGETISGAITGAWDTIKAVWDTVTGFFEGIWSGITSGEIFTKIGETISGVFTGAWDTIKAAWDTVTEFFSGIWTGITDGLVGLGDLIKAPFESALKAVQDAWSGVAGWFSGIWNSIFGGGNLEVPQVYTEEMAQSFKEQMGRAGQDMMSEMWMKVAENCGEAGSDYQSAKTTMLSAAAMIALGFQDEYEGAMREWGFDESLTAYYAQQSQNLIQACALPQASVDSVKQTFNDAGIQITDALAESLIGIGSENVGVALTLLAQGIDQDTIASLDLTNINKNISEYMNETGKSIEQVCNDLIAESSSSIAESAGDVGGEVGKALGKTIPEAVVEALDEGTSSVEDAQSRMVEAAKASQADVSDAQTSGTDLGSGLTDKTEAAITEGTSDVTTATESMTKSIDETIATLPEDIQPYATSMMDAIIQGITEGDPLIQTAIQTAADNVVNIVTEKLSSEEGLKIAQQFISGLETGIEKSEAETKAKTLAENTFNALNNKLTKDSGKTIGKDFADAIKDAIDNDHDPIVQVAEKIATETKSSIEKLLAKTNGYKIGYDFSNGLRTGIDSPKAMIFELVKMIGNNCKVLAQSLMSSDMGLSIGLQFANGIASGIGKGASNVVSAIVNLCKKAVAEAKKQLEIKSPSRVARDEIGMMFDKGLVAGLNDGVNLVEKAATNVSDTLRDSFYIGDPSMGTVYTSRQQARQTATETAAAASKQESIADKADRIGRAIANRLIESGVLESDIVMDGAAVGKKTAAPVSQELSRKSKQSVTGRSLQGVIA